MNLKTRLTIKFISQVLLLFGIVCVFGMLAVYYIFFENVEGASGTNPVLIVKSMPKATTVSGDSVSVAPWLLSNVDEVHGWVQILNGQGREVYEYHRPSRVPAEYPPGLLLEYRAYPSQFGYHVYSWYDRVDHQDLTWLLGVPYTGSSLLSELAPFLVMVLVVVASVIAAIVIALLFGSRLGAPLLHMMNWLQGLARGNYAEPENPTGVPRSRSRDGQLRRSYRLYAEVIETLTHLSRVLSDAQISRRRMEATRDEWITGVSHDLKTPLSSVKGYADLLSADQYDWSREEIRKFGGIIAEKASHMEGLIEDLGLTFRLKNEALPLVCEPKNVVEVVRRSAIDLVNRPDVDAEKLTFEASKEEILYPIDAKWFTRAIENLLANAVVHNPPHTSIEVHVRRQSDKETRESEPHSKSETGMHYDGVEIEIKDDGNGMDEETLLHLFDRYYRGTNTSEGYSKGSGLGCAIAKQLVEAHGGEVRASSRVGVGTTFSILLPPKNEGPQN